MKYINVLVACEFSGVVREAFNSIHGFFAISCDLLPPEDGRVDYHIQDDVRRVINGRMWDVLIAFSPCTYLCNSGVRWLWKDGEKNLPRWYEMARGAELFKTLLNAPIRYKALENPIMHKYALEIIGRKYNQIIQPWQFGHGETKATCLWLENLPPLQPTNIVSGRNQRVHNEPPSPERWRERSRTLPGIAMAMAEQWSKYILEDCNIESGQMSLVNQSRTDV